MNLYAALREQILADAGNDLKRYLIGLERIVSGNITFAVLRALLVLTRQHTIGDR